MSAVNEITNGMANTTVSDAPAHNETGATSEQAEAVLAVVAEGRRLYIGNLAYATTEGELNDFFTGYLVESVSIPVNPRSSRPVGYAFVDLSTATEAQRAINELSGKEILARKVSVQLARKPEDKKEATAAAADGETPREGGRRRNSGRGRGRGRGRGGRRGGASRNGDKGGEEALPLTDTTATSHNETNIAAGAAISGGEAAGEKAEQNTRTREPRQPRQRGPPEDGVPSKNKVMVANLPYDLSEEKLKELFAAYNPSAAKIALRPIPRFMVKKLQARNEPRKGRGFGFVSLESEEMQQKAVAEMNGKEIDGREIAVKVAIDSPGKEDIDPEAAGTAPLTENGVVQANDPPAAVTATAGATEATS